MFCNSEFCERTLRARKIRYICDYIKVNPKILPTSNLEQRRCTYFEKHIAEVET